MKVYNFVFKAEKFEQIGYDNTAVCIDTVITMKVESKNLIDAMSKAVENVYTMAIPASNIKNVIISRAR